MNELKYAIHKKTGKRVLLLLSREVLGTKEYLIVVDHGPNIKEDIEHCKKFTRKMSDEEGLIFTRGFIIAKYKVFWQFQDEIEMIENE